MNKLPEELESTVKAYLKLKYTFNSVDSLIQDLQSIFGIYSYGDLVVELIRKNKIIIEDEPSSLVNKMKIAQIQFNLAMSKFRSDHDMKIAIEKLKAQQCQKT